jgi:hypothetical protein
MQLRVDTDTLLGAGAQIRVLATDAEDAVGMAARALGIAAGSAGDGGVEAASDELMSAATTAHRMAAVLLRALGTVAVAGAQDYAHVEQQLTCAAGRP